MKMHVLDMFAGLGGWSKAFKDRGHSVDTVDIDPKFKPTAILDIMELSVEDMGDSYYDLILASPPCDCFSVASISRYWTPDHEPRNRKACKAFILMRHTFELLEGSGTRYIIENPRGKMRRLSPRPPNVTIWYCQYGDARAKPTDIWHNIPELRWRKQCHNNNSNCHHDKAPRSTKRGGTQDMSKSPSQRALIPYGLSLDVCLQMEKILEVK